MASRLWLLVEWVDDNNLFPCHGILNVDTMTCDLDITELEPGKIVFIRVKHENPRRAKILLVSESKRYVKEQREILERQDKQFQNVLQLCMHTIKRMKTENEIIAQQIGSHNTLPHVLVAQNDDSESDSDSQHNVKIERRKTRNSNKSTPKYTPQHNRTESFDKQAHGSLNANNPRRRSIISSTQLPSTSAQENIQLSFDQAMQTGESYPIPSSSLSAPKIEEIGVAVKSLYSKFVSMLSHANVDLNSLMPLSESEDIEAFINIEPNESPMDPNSSEESDEEVGAEEVGAEDVVEDNGANRNIQLLEQVNSSTINNEEQSNSNQNSPRVRRMSAQTTNNIETEYEVVPIGSGKAKVPARLMNDIDWSSYTSATRQLLQAVFPRKVLATHSLTGKPSPAFMNRPPKKILDPQLVDDIVKTVSIKCDVPKNVVRTCISVKCTDEAKLYRNRQQSGRNEQARRPPYPNDENDRPSTPSSD